MAGLRIVSGGQSGVDRAALDVAGELGLERGGWAPAGGWAEDEPQPPGVLARYPELRETASGDPAERTRRNVEDADATVVLVQGSMVTSPGTALTMELAAEAGRPLAVVDLERLDAAAVLSAFLDGLPTGATVNVAGPRESQCPGIGGRAAVLLRAVLGGRRS